MKNDNSKRDIKLEKGNYIEQVKKYIAGNLYQRNIYLDKIKYARGFLICLILIALIASFPAYYPLIQSWLIRNSKIEITNYEGASGDRVSLIAKNSGKKPGSIGSSWLIVENLLEESIRFPFDNGNSINNPNSFIKSGEEKRIILTRSKNWQNMSDTSHIAKVIQDEILPKIDNMNGQKDDLGLSCTLVIDVNQTVEAKPVIKEIEEQWQCLQAIGIFVDIWGDLDE